MKRAQEMKRREDEERNGNIYVAFELGNTKRKLAFSGVRVGVGQVGITWLVSLPGPTREAGIGVERLIEALEKGWGKTEAAEHIAAGIGAKWRGHGTHHYQKRLFSQPSG